MARGIWTGKHDLLEHRKGEGVPGREAAEAKAPGWERESGLFGEPPMV